MKKDLTSVAVILGLAFVTSMATALAQYYPGSYRPYSYSTYNPTPNPTSGYLGEPELHIISMDKQKRGKSEVITPDMIKNGEQYPLGYAMELLSQAPCFQGDPRVVLRDILIPGIDRVDAEKCGIFRVVSRDRIMISNCQMEKDGPIYSMIIQRCKDAFQQIPSEPPVSTGDFPDYTYPYGTSSAKPSGSPKPAVSPSPSPSASPAPSPSPRRS